MAKVILQNLTKTFGDVIAIDDLTLEIADRISNLARPVWLWKDNNTQHRGRPRNTNKRSGVL